MKESKIYEFISLYEKLPSYLKNDNDVLHGIFMGLTKCTFSTIASDDEIYVDGDINGCVVSLLQYAMSSIEDVHQITELLYNMWEVSDEELKQAGELIDDETMSAILSELITDEDNDDLVEAQIKLITRVYSILCSVSLTFDEESDEDDEEEYLPD